MKSEQVKYNTLIIKSKEMVMKEKGIKLVDDVKKKRKRKDEGAASICP